MGDNQTLEITAMSNPSLFLKLIILQIDRIKINSLKQMNGVSNPQKSKTKLYKIFLKLIDKDSAKQLAVIDSQLNKTIREFELRTGWLINHEKVYLCATLKDSKGDLIYIEDFKIPRDPEYGFYIPELQPTETEPRHRQGEMQFYEKNYESLTLIHELMAAKERIIYGEYEPLKEEYKDTLLQIVECLGYPPKSNSVPKLVLEPKRIN